ncbi:MAG: hypothetical protein R3C43_09600 [Chloroflexota bacterium]
MGGQQGVEAALHGVAGFRLLPHHGGEVAAHVVPALVAVHRLFGTGVIARKQGGNQIVGLFFPSFPVNGEWGQIAMHIGSQMREFLQAAPKFGHGDPLFAGFPLAPLFQLVNKVSHVAHFSPPGRSIA